MSVRIRLRRFWIINVAPVSKTRARATCATTNAPVHRRSLRPPALVRPISFNVATMALLDACQAGTRPHRIELPRQITARYAKTARSIGKCSQYGGADWAAKLQKIWMLAYESPRPSTPATEIGRA